MDQDELVESACQEIIERTGDRRAVLIFASGVKHGRHVQRVLQEEHGVQCGFVCGETPTRERDELLDRFRCGKLADDQDKLMELAVAPLSLTANGGRQYVFRQPAGRAWRNTAGKLAPKVDTRADGGYIVAPPSVLAGGKAYAWAEGMALDEAPENLPGPPAWLVAELEGLATTSPTSPRVAALGDDGNPIHSGQRNATLARLAGLEKMIGPEGVASHAGLISAVEKQPAILFQLDEIGRMLKTIGEPSRSPHLYHIATVLMKMFTSAGTVYMGDAYADVKRNKKIYQPHVCLYGTTVPQSLYEGLTTESVTDGFLSRMLVFETNNHDPDAQEVVAQEVPKSIVEQTRFWGAFSPGGNLSGENPQPMVVAYSDEAREAMIALEQRTREQRLQCGEPVATLWTRTTEKARKLALIYACSANAEAPVVDEAAVNWAATVSEYLTRKAIFVSADWVSETPFEAKRKRVLREIRKAGDEGLTRTQLYRKTKHLQTKERTEIIDSLQATGEIKEERVQTGGAPKVTYKAC